MELYENFVPKDVLKWLNFMGWGRIILTGYQQGNF
jgi:hypothetical protein